MLMEIPAGDVEVGTGVIAPGLVTYKMTRTHGGFPQWFSSDAQVKQMF
jgi:hypothetical protein